MLSQINDSGTNLFNGPINLPTRSLAHSPTFSGLMHLLANFTPVELSPTDINLPLVHARTRTHTHTHPHPPTHPPAKSFLIQDRRRDVTRLPFFFPRLGVQWRGQSALNTKLRKHTHLLRNILSNYCCGVHRACTNNPLKSDRKIGWLSEKTIVEEFFLCPCKKQLFHLTKSAVNQIAKTEQWIETCRHRSSEEGSDAA